MSIENITIGEIAIALAFIVALMGSVKYLKNGIKESLTTAIDTAMKPYHAELSEIKKSIQDLSVSNDKNYLVPIISRLEGGGKISESEAERFYEAYEDYQRHGGNSYISTRVEKLKAEGKL